MTPPFQALVATSVMAFSSILASADNLGASVTVSDDGRSCHIEKRGMPCSDVLNALIREMHVPKTASLTVSPAGCGEGAIAKAQVVAGALKKGGFETVFVIGFITQPNTKCAP